MKPTTFLDLIIFLLVPILSVQCVRHEDGLEQALKLAGSNRTELEAVLSRYSENPADSLKFRAAVFLIENMPGHTYYRGGQLEQYLEYYPLLRETMKSGLAPTVAADSIRNLYGTFDADKLELCKDIETVDSAYLCDNIEWAFKVWKEQPWGKNVSFEDFCEYILPYRVGNETLAGWRKEYYEEFNGILAPLRASSEPDKEDPINAARTVLTHIWKTKKVFFTMNAPAALPNAGPKAVKYNAGTCREFSDYVLYVCRSLGIPCARDYMPVRGGDNSGHSWTAFWDKDGTPYLRDNEGPLLRTKGSGLYNWAKGKVYRQQFGHNQEAELILESIRKRDAAGFLYENIFSKDVTDIYSDYCLDSLVIPDSLIYEDKIRGIGSHHRVIYLCMTSRMDWIPVGWTEPQKEDVVFSKVTEGSLYRLSATESGRAIFLTDPFYLSRTGEVHVFRNGGQERDMTVYGKYPEPLAARMTGGVFEVSNDEDFHISDTLYVIKEKPWRLYNTVPLQNSGSYRYIRYFGPPKGYSDLSELAFYDSSGQKIEGKPIGSGNGYDSRHGYMNAYDGSTLTSFSFGQPYGGWTGMDFGAEKNVAKITYSPRNRVNYVYEGNLYELFYCDVVWKSAGQVIAASDSVVFQGVPEGVLYLLKNHSGGVQERAFSYKDGRQLWDLENEAWFQ